jgi:hypothetical protein
MNDSVTARCAGGSAWRPIVLLPVLATVLMVAPAFRMLPVYDDWFMGGPILTFDWNLLRPQRIFWRPFEMLWRGLLALEPGLHPHLSHALAACAHASCVLLVFALVRAMRLALPIAATTAAAFAIFPSVAAAVWSIDGVAQTMSSAFGLLGVFAFIKGSGGRRLPLWIACAALSVLWKESGIAWFLGVPLLGTLIQVQARDRRIDLARLMQPLGIGLLGVVAYLALRALLATGQVLGEDEGRYSVQFNPATWLVNLSMLLAVTLSPLDTVSLFGDPRRIGAVVLTAALGLPLLMKVVLHLPHVYSLPVAVLAVASVLAVMGPHLLMGRVSEMHAHHVTAVVFLILAPAVAAAASQQKAILVGAGIAMLAAALLTNLNKMNEMVLTGERAATVGFALVEAHGGAPPPRYVCVIRVGAEQARGYSVFQASPGPAAAWSLAARGVWGYGYPARQHYALDVQACPADVDVIWEISVVGAVRVLARR